MPFGTARRRTASRAGHAAVLDLSGWQLVAPDDEGRVLVPETGLKATRRGLNVVRPDCIVRSWTWSAVTGIGVGSQVQRSDAEILRLLELQTIGGRHLFVCSQDALDTLRSFLEEHAPHLATAVPNPARPRVLERVAAPIRAGRAMEAVARARRDIGRHIFLGRSGAADTVRNRLTPLGAALAGLALIGGGLVASVGASGGTVPASNRASESSAGSIMSRMDRLYGAKGSIDLPAATTVPAPAPPTLAGGPPLGPHEIFGFAPYWTLPSAPGFDLHDLTTLAYFSVDVNGDGSIAKSGPGWSGYESQDLTNLITRAHQAGVRVVLTTTCFGAANLNALTSSPTAPATLASSLVDLLGAKSLDGVNFDFEGQGSQDQLGLDRLVADVSGALHGADPHWQVTMDTYSSSAGDPGGFYDVPGLAQSVDAFFVMAYDMYDASVPSPNAALTGSGFTDLDALKEYTSVVPASKVILGVPYYGYDWPTAGPALGDPATGPPTPVSYAQVAAADHPVYWDPSSQTPWTSYQVGTQWHQIWFDDATSLALKAQLASSYHIAGLGVWALGMDGNDPSMMAALLGNSPAVKNFQPSPAPAGQGQPPQAAQGPSGTGSTTSTTVAPQGSPQGAGPAGGPSGPGVPSSLNQTGYSYSGTWEQQTVTLDQLGAGMTPAIGLVSAGQLTGFSTDDPAYTCLEQGPPLPVYPVFGASDLYVVEAPSTSDCAHGSWEFVAQSSSTGSSTGAGSSSQGATNSSLSSALAGTSNRARRDG